MRWSRRELLAGALAVVAGAPLGLRGCRGDSAADSAANAALDAALEGRRVLALGTGWNTEAALRRGLRPRLADPQGPDATRATLAEAVREDFRDARTVDIEGWRLAETEARLYALAALRLSAARDARPGDGSGAETSDRPA